MRLLLQLLAFLWASPYSLIGMLIGGLGLATGGHVRRRGRVLEFHGGGTRWFVRHLPLGKLTAACTLGHVILGQDVAMLDYVRDHEMVHVRQFERWGPFMLPAYAAASFVLWIRGRRPYRDNPFEREAYGDD